MIRSLILALFLLVGVAWSSRAQADCAPYGNNTLCSTWQEAKALAMQGIPQIYLDQGLGQGYCDANWPGAQWEMGWLGPAFGGTAYEYDFFDGYGDCYHEPGHVGVGVYSYVRYFYPKGSYTGPFSPDRNKGACAGQKSCFGDPINAGTGNKFEIVTEYHGNGPNPLEFSWTYNSSGAATQDSPADLTLGANRSHFYQRRLRVLGSGNSARVSITRADGNVVYFKSNEQATAFITEVETDGKLFTTRDGSGVITRWDYLTPSRDTETFDAIGRLVAITDAYGNAQTLAYDANQRLSNVTDRSGRLLTFEYYADGKISRLTLPDGNPVVFTYDASANLVNVDHVGAGATTYVYNEPSHTANTDLPHALTGEIDGNGDRYSTTDYDSLGRAIGTFLGNGVARYSATYTSSADGLYNTTAAITTPSGKIRSMQLRPVNLNGGQVVATGFTDSCSGCATRNESYTYDGAGRIDTETDVAGVVTDYDYDSYGNVSQVIHAKGTPQQQTEFTVWAGGTNPLPQQIDRYGQSISYTYNGRFQPVTSTLTDTANNATRVTTKTYCEPADVDAGICPLVGLLLKVDGPRTDVVDITTYSYYSGDDSGCTTSPTRCSHRKGDLASITNPLGQTTQYLLYDGAGRVLSSKDANGVVTDLEYGPTGQLVARKVRGSDNSTEADDAITRFTYDGAGQLTRTTMPDSSVAIIDHDSAHRITGIRDGLGNSVQYRLDDAGNRMAEDTRDGNQVLKKSLSRLFNSLGQMQTFADAYSTPTDFTYDAKGRIDTVRDPLGHVTDRDYDQLGRLKQVVENTGGASTERAVQTYGYDARDNLTSVIDPKSLTTSYTFDGLDNLTKVVSPDTGTTTYTLDSAGNRRTATDARGKTTTYTWDALNRNTAQTVATIAQNVYFDYDQPQSDCATGETFGAGRLSRIRDESGTTRWCYDRHGNVVRKVQTVVGGTTLTVGTTYNSADRLAAITYPSGAIVVYSRDGDGRITGIAAQPKAGASQVTLVNDMTYLPYGPRASITFGNGRKVTYAYDNNYVIDKASDSVTSAPFSEDMTVDAVGNITAVSEQTTVTGSAARTYGYDGLNRLVSMKNGSANVESYAYEATGDRTSKTVGSTTDSYTYASTNHRLTMAKDARNFDANGNTTLIGTASKGTVLTFDDRNRLRDAKVANKSVASYRYNGKGQRVLKSDLVTASNSRQFVYDEAGRLLGIYSTTTGARVQEFVWADETLVAILSDHDGGTYQFVESDHLGTPRAVVNPTKNTIVWRWTQTGSGFGDHLPVEDPDGNAVGYSLNLRFPGQVYDAETKMTYNLRRDYEAATGRYLESDPIGLAGGMSTYGYAMQNPERWTDRSGLEVNWQGTMIGVSAADVLGAGVYWFDLKSNCVNNRRGRAQVVAAAVITGLEADVKVNNVRIPTSPTAGGQNVSFSQPGLKPDGNVFGGPFGMANAAIAVYGWTWIRLGELASEFGPDGFGWQLNVNVGVSAQVGLSSVLDTYNAPCECATK